MKKISGSMLYDAIKCPHRITMDLFGDPELRDPANELLVLLWEEGNYHEKEVVAAMDPAPTDLSALAGDEKEDATWQAIQRRDPLIYGGRLTHEDLVGEPDLLRWTGNGYEPGDIKSGKGGEGENEEGDVDKPKKHYMMQIAHYAHLLERLDLSDRRQRGFIIDRDAKELGYDLTAPVGVRNRETHLEVYGRLLDQIRAVHAGDTKTRPALSAVCKECHWRTECRRTVVADDDLTQIAELGRSKRDALFGRFGTVRELAEADISELLKGKTGIPTIGSGTLAKFKERAVILTNAIPAYTRQRFEFDFTHPYLLFDIEDDPLRDVVYLHGFVSVDPATSSAQYKAFFADDPTPDAERQAFVEAVTFLRAWPRDCKMVYYSTHERTKWRKLQQRYPDVATEAEIEEIFDPSFAYDVYTNFVKKHTEWPLNDVSIKSLAKYLGFQWRDEDPSGASSIVWYHEWTKYREPETKKRILDYNEDDCRAMQILCEGLAALPVRPGD